MYVLNTTPGRKYYETLVGRATMLRNPTLLSCKMHVIMTAVFVVTEEGERRHKSVHFDGHDTVHVLHTLQGDVNGAAHADTQAFVYSLFMFIFIYSPYL